MRAFFEEAEKYRVRKQVGVLPPTKTGNLFGVFVIHEGNDKQIRCIVSDSDPNGVDTGWEHVSVTVLVKSDGRFVDAMPHWDDMCFVKQLFWKDDECVVQFHPPKKDYVNVKENCLHLWKNTKGAIPTPPSFMV